MTHYLNQILVIVYVAGWYSKLQYVFSIQKRCTRLLFGTKYSFDHTGYYETCARVRSYIDHKAAKNYLPGTFKTNF